MTKPGTVGTSASLILLLVIVLGGFALLAAVTILFWGFMVPTVNVLDHERRQALAEDAARLRQQQALIGAEWQRQFGAELALQELEMDDPAPEDGEQPRSLNLEELRKAQQVADTYLEHLRARRWPEANELLTPELAEESKRLGNPPYAKFLRPEWQSALSGVRSNTRCCRLRYQFWKWEGEKARGDFTILLVPHEGTYRIKDMRGGGLQEQRMPAAFGEPPGLTPP